MNTTQRCGTVTSEENKKLAHNMLAVLARLFRRAPSFDHPGVALSGSKYLYRGLEIFSLDISKLGGWVIWYRSSKNLWSCVNSRISEFLCLRMGAANLGVCDL